MIFWFNYIDQHSGMRHLLWFWHSSVWVNAKHYFPSEKSKFPFWNYNFKVFFFFLLKITITEYISRSISRSMMLLRSLEVVVVRGPPKTFRFIPRRPWMSASNNCENISAWTIVVERPNNHSADIVRCLGLETKGATVRSRNSYTWYP